MERVEFVPRFFLYGEAEQDVEPRFIHIETIPSSAARLHNWYIAPHRHSNLLQLLLATAADGESRSDAVVQRFTAPALVISPAAVVHGFRFAPQIEGWVLSVAQSYAAEILSEAGGHELMPYLTEPAMLELDAAAMTAHHLAERFHAIEDEFHWSGLGRTAAISAHLRLLFVATARLRHDRSLDIVARGSDEALFAKFRVLIEAHYREQQALGAYAKALAASESRLATVCRRIAGRSPLETIHARVMVEAKRNLLYTSMTVSEVGYSLGFRDPAYFSRFFARRAGMPPNLFRRQHSGLELLKRSDGRKPGKPDPEHRSGNGVPR